MKQFRRIFALLLVLLLLLPCVSCSAVKNPLHYLKNSAVKTARGSYLGDFLEVLSAGLEQGALSLSFSGMEEKLGVARGAVTTYFSAKDDAITVIANAAVGEAQYDADLFLTEDEVVLRSNAFLGSNTLGISFGSMEKDIRTSIFRNNSGTPYADPDINDTTAARLDGVRKSFFELLSETDDMQELSKDVLDAFLTALEKHASTAYYRKDGRMYVDVSIDNRALAQALRDTRKMLVGDRSFCKDLRAWAKECDRISAAFSGAQSNKVTQRAEAFLTNDAGVEEICQKLDLALPFSILVSGRVKISHRTLEQLTISHETKLGRTELLRIDLGEKNVVKLAFLQVGSLRRELVIRVREDTRKQLLADLEVSSGLLGVEMQRHAGTFSWDKKAKTYCIELTHGTAKTVVSGALSLSSGQFKCSIDQLELGGVSSPLRLCFEVNVGAKAPQMPEYTNYFAVSQAQYARINEILQPALDRARADLMPLWQRFSDFKEKFSKPEQEAPSLDNENGDLA